MMLKFRTFIPCCLILAFFLTLESFGQPSNSKEAYLSFSVWGSKGFVEGVSKDQVAISIGGKPAEILELSQPADPAAVGVLVDTSSSVKSTVLKDPKFVEGLQVLFKNLSPNNEYFLMTFGDGDLNRCDFTNEPESVRQCISDAEGRKARGGGTRLYDAMSDGLQQLSSSSKPRKILIIVSDGEDTGSKIDFDAASKKLRQSDIESYFINVFTTGRPREQFIVQSEAEAKLGNLMTQLGGAMYNVSKPEQSQITFRILAYQLRNYYRARIVIKTDSSAVKLRGVKLTLKKPIYPNEAKSIRMSVRREIYL